MQDTERKPRVMADFAPIETTMAAAGFVAREWGEYGYAMTGCVGHYIDGPELFYRFGVKASDGSYFEVLADRWGNTREVPEGSEYFCW